MDLEFKYDKHSLEPHAPVIFRVAKTPSDYTWVILGAEYSIKWEGWVQCTGSRIGMDSETSITNQSNNPIKLSQ